MSNKRTVKSVKDGYEVQLTSDTFARAVFMSIDGIDNFFGNNYFDILPKETVTVKVISTLPQNEFEAQLRNISLRDAY